MDKFKKKTTKKMKNFFEKNWANAYPKSGLKHMINRRQDGGGIRMGFETGGGFAFLVVLFILLIIVGAAYIY